MLFFSFENNSCELKNKLPSYWDIQKQRRFTDEDIALAKALKAKGVSEVHRNGENVYV